MDPVKQTLDQQMTGMRASLKIMGQEILEIKKTTQTAEITGVEDRAEELANLTLAYRHLEDCIMRLGKVIQAYNGGENPYEQKA